MSDTKTIEGFEIPLYVALTQPPLFFGLPRELGIFAMVVTLVITLGLRMWLVGMASGIGLYAGCMALTRHDAYWFLVLRVHLKQLTYLDW